MRFNLVQPEAIQTRQSAGYVKDIYEPAISVRQPLSDYQTFLEVVHRVPSLDAAYTIMRNFLIYRGYDFIQGTRKKRDDLRSEFEDLNFDQVAANLVHGLMYYGDAFLELRKQDSSKVNELWPLETTEMRIIYNKHGKVEGYVQRPFNIQGLSEEEILAKEKEKNPVTGDTYGVFFKPEDVIHFRMKWIGSQVYSYNPNASISTAASTKLYADNYLMNIFMNMPPRYVAILAGASQKDLDQAKIEFRSAKTNYKKTIAFTRSSDPNAKLTMQKVDAPYDDALLKVFDWVDNEIAKVTMVPRNWILMSDTENRGVGESLLLPFFAQLGYVHRVVLEPPINSKLLPLLGNAKKAKGSEKMCKFKFNQPSIKVETEILTNLQTLQTMGLKPEAAVRYLETNGILGIDEDDFQDPMEMQLAGLKATVGAKDKDQFPSRKRMDKMTDDMTQNRNEGGVSDSSGSKMRQEALA